MKKSHYIGILTIIIIFIFSYYYIVSAATEGPNYSSSVSDCWDNTPDTCDGVSSSYASDWTMPHQAGFFSIDDDQYATTEFTGGGEFDPSYSYGLDLRNFNFSIPSGKTITGIQVSVDRMSNTNVGSMGTKDYKVRLLKGGVVVGNNKADTGSLWPTSEATATYGGSADLWGTTWTVDDINSSGFGVLITVEHITGDGSVITSSIDTVSITVTYSDALTGAAGATTMMMGMSF